MACSALSVVMSIAAAGLAGGGGLVPGLDGFDLGSLGELGINTDLMSGFELDFGIDLDILSDFDLASMEDVLGGLDETIGSVVDDAVAACGEAVQSALGDLPEGLTGQIDFGSFNEYLTEGLDLSSTNVYQCLGEQSKSFLQNGIPSLTECVNSCKAFVEQSAGALASMQRAATFTIGNQSFNALTIFDQVTGGAASRALQPVTAIVGAASAGASVAGGILQTTQSTINNLQTNYSAFTKDVGEWGNMYDVTKLDTTFEANEFAQHLANQNIPEFNNYLYQEGQFPPATIGQADPAAVLKVLQSVPANIVDTVTKAVGFTKKITNLADALVPAAVLSAGALALVGSFRGVSQRLGGIGPTNVNTIGELGKALNKVEFPPSSVLLGIESNTTGLKDIVNYNTEERKKLTGSGSGVFGNPTMNDMMGSFTGTYYTPRLLGTLSAQKRLIDSPEGQALKQAISTAVDHARTNLNTDAADAAAIRSAAQALLSKTDTSTQEDLVRLNRFYKEIINQLLLEKRNLKAARISQKELQGSLSSILAFVNNLEVAYIDDYQVGYADWIKAAADRDAYGDAIRYSIIEAKNRAILNSIGVNTSTVNIFDYTEQYAKEQAAILAKCCPPYSMQISELKPGSLISTYVENGQLYGIYIDEDGLTYYKVISTS